MSMQQYVCEKSTNQKSIINNKADNLIYEQIINLNQKIYKTNKKIQQLQQLNYQLIQQLKLNQINFKHHQQKHLLHIKQLIHQNQQIMQKNIQLTHLLINLQNQITFQHIKHEQNIKKQLHQQISLMLKIQDISQIKQNTKQEYEIMEHFNLVWESIKQLSKLLQQNNNLMKDYSKNITQIHKRCQHNCKSLQFPYLIKLQLNKFKLKILQILDQSQILSIIHFIKPIQNIIDHQYHIYTLT